MGARTERLAQRLEAKGTQSVDFFSQFGRHDWDRTVYTEGASWTLEEVAKHLLSSERAMARLIALVVRGEPGVPEDFDLDGYNERKVAELDGLSPDEVLSQFAEARKDTIRLVQTFSDSDLDKMGRHPFLGQSSVEAILQLIYRHNQIHQRDLRRLIPASPE